MTTKWDSAGMRTAAVALAAALLTGFAPSSPAVAEEDAPTVSYERTAYDGTIWSITASGAYALSYDQWKALGFPAFTTAPTEYVRAAPFHTVYAVTWFELAQSELTEDITYPEYVAAGKPQPTVFPWLDGIEVHKWPTSNELFGTDSAGSTVRLNYSQWSAAGFPSFATRENRGFVSMSWDGSGAIAYMCDISAGRGGRITYDQWRSLGFPTPMRVNRTAADTVTKIASRSEPTVYYSGPIVRDYAPGTIPSQSPFRALTYPEWRGMGSPAPLVTNTTYPENWSCSGSQPSPWE